MNGFAIIFYVKKIQYIKIHSIVMDITASTSVDTSVDTSTIDDKKGKDHEETQEIVEPPALPKLFNLVTACELISDHYDRAFKNLRFVPPLQMVDGGAVEFVDLDFNNVVATARLRFLNQMRLDNSTGAMAIDVALSDMTFKQNSVPLAITRASK